MLANSLFNERGLRGLARGQDSLITGALFSPQTGPVHSSVSVIHVSLVRLSRRRVSTRTLAVAPASQRGSCDGANGWPPLLLSESDKTTAATLKRCYFGQTEAVALEYTQTLKLSIKVD